MGQSKGARRICWESGEISLGWTEKGLGSAHSNHQMGVLEAGRFSPETVVQARKLVSVSTSLMSIDRVNAQRRPSPTSYLHGPASKLSF